MNLFVTGGAGYIGSHMVKYLGDAGHQVVVLDNLSNGFADSVIRGELIRGDLADQDLIRRVLRDHAIEAVFHFASFIQVGESNTDPASYYRNNVVNTIHLLDAMRSAQISRLVFSSTAAVYGEPLSAAIPEAHPIAPINPYGRTKAMVESLLQDYHYAYGLQSVALRYFNAAGADPGGELGERHNPETHLIPLVLQVASGRREAVAIFGRDYETLDGTCIRDYVHVMDLASAHEQALHFLMAQGGYHVFNLGTGLGYSVQQVIAAAERVTGRFIRIDEKPRRPGDPACLVADATKAQTLLDWSPRLSDLDTLIAHAWAWELKRVAS
jgi:UDP-glucose 4-epimerase